MTKKSRKQLLFFCSLHKTHNYNTRTKMHTSKHVLYALLYNVNNSILIIVHARTLNVYHLKLWRSNCICFKFNLNYESEFRLIVNGRISLILLA